MNRWNAVRDDEAANDGPIFGSVGAASQGNQAESGAATLPSPSVFTLALIGNPNIGKTSLFNRLTNLLAKTSNFPGTTVERRVGMLVDDGGRKTRLVDLPGLYSLEAQSPEEQVSRDFLLGVQGSDRPDGVVVVVDATNLERSLFVAGQVLEAGRPTVVAVNMADAARARRLDIDTELLSARLGCPVVMVSARTGEGLTELRRAMCQLSCPAPLKIIADTSCDSCHACPYAQGHRWSATLAREVTRSSLVMPSVVADRLDSILTHASSGPFVFAAVMLCVFALVFWVAQYPMELLDASFGRLAQGVSDLLPAGDLSSLLTDGVIGGVGGVLVFLPQILLLFFALAVLEDSGYLSRAVVVVDRWVRRVGLPGQAFVPLLAAHACAIPAIMSTKVIENRRDRLAAIMVIPLMTCSARLPVYTMIAAMLFPRHPLYASLLFASGYALGMVAAFVVSWVLKKTILPGEPSPLILDLPPYRLPSLSNAGRYALDRGWVFLRDAGTVILTISIAIWVLSTYPKLSDEAMQVQISAARKMAASNGAPQEELDAMEARIAQEHSLIGRGGKFVEPIFRPLGFDWKTSVGVLTSFAAREVVVSTLSVLYGLGDEAEASSLHARLSAAKKSDGSRVFDTATCVSLLVFFVLAMQCLPTQAVTRKETGSWKWAAFQFGYMSILAYTAAFVARQVVLGLAT